MKYVVVITSALLAATVNAQPPRDATLDRKVISKLSTQYRIHSKVIQHLDLTEPFQTVSRWSLVVAKQPDNESNVGDGLGNPMGAIYFCFVKKEEPDCSHEIFRVTKESGRDPFYQLFGIDVVFAGPEKTLPLLRTKTCGTSGAKGKCNVSTFLLAYDRSADRFRVVFSNFLGRNNNEEARFIENGPLLGHVIVAYPTQNAPFTYFVEVFQQVSGGQYSQVLRYRGNTHYGDGNLLAVIDSEMPETLRRFGLWQDGDPVPVPPRMPRGCGSLVMRKGVAWCQAGR